MDESWTIKKAECQSIDAFEVWCWRLLRVPWTSRRSNRTTLKEISSEYSLEALMLKLKLQKFGHLMRRTTHWKRSWCWEGLKAGGEGDNRGWDAWMDQLLNRHEFSKLWGLVMDRKARHAAVHGVPKSQTPWMTELNWSIWESLRGKWCWGTSWHRAVSLCYIPD